MLKKAALDYYNKGYNCSQCIIMAAIDIFRLNLPSECVDMCKGINNGLGIGGICSVLLACIMIISIMYPQDIKAKRLELLYRFSVKYGNINCGKIKSKDCSHIIAGACDILEDIL